MKAQNDVKIQENRLTVYQMTLTGMMTALLCILGPLSVAVPVSPVPISLGSLGMYLAAAVLGRHLGTLSCLLYLLIGMIGLPVFSGYTGGAGRLLGPTGGYLVGFAFLVLIAGCFTGRFSQDRWKSRLWAALGMVLGTAVLYFLGTFWLACLSGISFYEALWAGVIPFIPGDIVKILAAVLLGTPLRGRLIQAGFLTGGALEKH